MWIWLPQEMMAEYKNVLLQETRYWKFQTPEYAEAWVLYLLLEDYYVQNYPGFMKNCEHAPDDRSPKEKELFSCLRSWYFAIRNLQSAQAEPHLHSKRNREIYEAVRQEQEQKLQEIALR